MKKVAKFFENKAWILCEYTFYKSNLVTTQVAIGGFLLLAATATERLFESHIDNRRRSPLGCNFEAVTERVWEPSRSG